jgi:hypothetical protein
MRRPIGRSSASLENHLDGDVGDGSALALVLAAARAPGSSAELHGLDAAMASFALVSREPSRNPASHRAKAPQAVSVGRFALKAIGAIGGLSLAGGVAFAATTGTFTGGSSNDSPSRHHSVPSHSVEVTGTVDRVLPFLPGSASSAAGAHARTSAVNHVGEPHRAGQPTEPSSSHPAHPSHPPSPTHPAPSSDTVPSHPGKTKHVTPPSHPAKPAPSSHPAPTQPAKP